MVDSESMIPFDEQVGLALRGYRRAHGLSQRAFADVVDVAPATLARLERSALSCSLETVVRLLAQIGHSLAVVDADGQPVTTWDETDLRARDRSGRRFPANREVRPMRVQAAGGPQWWLHHEYFGTGECGPQPEWTAEGFSSDARFGRKPRPRAPGEKPRWL
ncbi:helix-turn-helix domain-containing protein [Oceanitalea stevensii]|uniref:Helix-turn-helix transcriptional regulator n=1 Tax=Oceanitalea stevensii TaxID=2763072 RepID=A0ABR8Z189_9MICO|nr:helix-turn-helix transcriptional regulator [Oceanitalea stevensii]MBD8062076.1 helix-turn-helix transcriptional regulator [Oceanitalea stevensii]